MDEKLTVRRMSPLHLLPDEYLIFWATDRGVDLHTRDSVGKTVLQCAIEQDRVELTEFFLEKGADVNVADNKGKTPLLAATGSHEAGKLIPLLLKHGADVTTRDIDGRNVLHWLGQSCYAWLSIDTLDDLVKVLIAKGASIKDRDHALHHQPLHTAVDFSKTDMVEVLLDHGAYVDAQTVNGEFPLYIATKAHVSIPLLKTLLKHGANVDMKTGKGRTTLHALCDQRTDYPIESIRLLLSAGADICIEDPVGKTAIALLDTNVDWTFPDPQVMLMTQALALKRVCLPASIELKDEKIINQHPEFWKYYQECIQSVSKAKSTKIIESCSLLELLTKCHCQIAPLMRHREFESQFRKLDLEAFFFKYSFDIREAFECAEDRYHEMLEQENVINEAVYNILPHLVVQKVVGYIFHCKMKKCASSRRQQR